MHFTNPVGTVKDGAIFLWTGAGDRPEVAVQIFLHNDATWYQEFSSLATEPVKGGRPWHAEPRGVELKAIPGAPKPAETAGAAAAPDPRPDRGVFCRRAVRAENLAEASAS